MVEVRTPIFPFLGTTLPETIPSLPSPTRPGSCHTYDKGKVFQVPPDMGNSPFLPFPRVDLALAIPAAREGFASYHLIAVGSLPVLPRP